MFEDKNQHFAYLLALEYERNDTTHRVLRDSLADAKYGLSKPQVTAIKALVSAEIEQLKSMREQRDKLFFDAGRWAGGARDSVAVAANSIMDALLESEA
jgi:hypothetical protein